MYFKNSFKFEFVIFITDKEKFNMPLLSTKVIISHWDFPVKIFALFSYFVFISGIEKISVIYTTIKTIYPHLLKMFPAQI